MERHRHVAGLNKVPASQGDAANLLIAEILFREAEAKIDGKAEPDTTDPAASPASATGDKAAAEKDADSDSSGTGNKN